MFQQLQSPSKIHVAASSPQTWTISPAKFVQSRAAQVALIEVQRWGVEGCKSNWLDHDHVVKHARSLIPMMPAKSYAEKDAKTVTFSGQQKKEHCSCPTSRHRHRAPTQPVLPECISVTPGSIYSNSPTYQQRFSWEFTWINNHVFQVWSNEGCDVFAPNNATHGKIWVLSVVISCHRLPTLQLPTWRTQERLLTCYKLFWHVSRLFFCLGGRVILLHSLSDL